ncbi:MAG TPA: DUF6338 family protein [Dermatophilaceae bacterium]|jgi:hypothetical protein
MPPASLIALAIVIVAVIPGSMYTWAYEREASAFGVTLADRTLRFIAISLLFHLALGWPEYTLYRVALAGPHFEVGQFAAIWVAVLLVVAMPVFIGTVLGGLYATRNSREDWDVIRSRLSPERERRLLRLALGRTPAPRAWDDLFSDRPTMYLRVQTTDGTPVAGLFANDSYAGGFPHDADLFLEDAWDLADDGSFAKSLGYPVYIPAGQIARMEIVRPLNGAEEAINA